MKYDRAGQLFEFKSEDKAWVTGGKGALDFEGFVEQKWGERNQRVVIRGFQIHAQFNLTVATAALKGEELYRIFRQVTVEQKDGVKRYDDVPGDSIRISNYAFIGGERTKEHNDFAIGTADVTVTAYIPMAKPFAYDGLDHSLAADVFKLLRIKMAQNADMPADSTAVVTINSGKYWVIAECYLEEDVVQHAVDTVVVRDFDAGSQSKLNITGRLHDLLIYAPGMNGSQTLGDVADVRIKELQNEALHIVPDLSERYARWRRIVTGGPTQGASLRKDPFLDGNVGYVRAIAAVMTNGNKVDDGPELNGVHVVTSSQTSGNGHTATLRMIARTNEPLNDKLTASLGKKYKATKHRPKRTAASDKPVSQDRARYMPRQLLK